MTRSRSDRLVVGVPDLEAGVDWLESITGVRAAAGGTYTDDGAGDRPGVSAVIGSPMGEVTIA